MKQQQAMERARIMFGLAGILFAMVMAIICFAAGAGDGAPRLAPLGRALVCEAIALDAAIALMGVYFVHKANH
ncbi:hypothetical protein ABIC83_003042 [Roseateles asaccharophilus]|uniref:hypothetical protein n=1 Tax=Roseateles asaccharophilus TaxID=582607 RepID=UPI003835C79E